CRYHRSSIATRSWPHRVADDRGSRGEGAASGEALSGGKGDLREFGSGFRDRVHGQSARAARQLLPARRDKAAPGSARVAIAWVWWPSRSVERGSRRSLSSEYGRVGCSFGIVRLLVRA